MAYEYTGPGVTTYLGDWTGPTEEEIAEARSVLMETERRKSTGQYMPYSPMLTICGQQFVIEHFILARESPFGLAYMGARGDLRLMMIPNGSNGEQALVEIIAKFCMSQDMMPDSADLEGQLRIFLASNVFLNAIMFFNREWSEASGIKHRVRQEISIQHSKASPAHDALAAMAVQVAELKANQIASDKEHKRKFKDIWDQPWTAMGRRL